MLWTSLRRTDLLACFPHVAVLLIVCELLRSGGAVKSTRRWWSLRATEQEGGHPSSEDRPLRPSPPSRTASPRPGSQNASRPLISFLPRSQTSSRSREIVVISYADAVILMLM